MKKICIRSVSLILLTILLILVTGCKNKDNTTTTTNNIGTSSTTKDNRSKGEISEATMNNFIKKVNASNYILDCPTFSKVIVASDNLVTIEYTYKIDYLDYNYDGTAFMSLENGETFFAFLDTNSVAEIEYINNGNAHDIETCCDEIESYSSRALKHWFSDDVTEGNVWNLFYNDQDNPYKFSSNDQVIKETVQIIAGVAKTALPRMQDVYIELDGEDPTSGTIKTSFSEGYPPLNDITINITFGNATEDPRAKAWMEDTNRTYPDPKTSWNETDEMNLNAVFLPEYGLTAVPFPSFASYTFRMDISGILSDDEIRIYDTKATRGDMNTYANELITKGFRMVSENGKTYYRLMLRPDYKCYSEIYLEYDNGVYMVARKYYDFDTYNSLSSVNTLITNKGYAELPTSSALSFTSGTDRTNELLESWLYFFGYDLVLYVDFSYTDKESVEDYLESYIDSLAGFIPAYEDDEYEEELELFNSNSKDGLLQGLIASPSESTYYVKEDTTGIRSFRYHFDEVNRTVSFLFKSETYIAKNTLSTALSTTLFPEINLDSYSSCRDFIKFEKTMYGIDAILDYSLFLEFDTASAADSYLDNYINTLRDDDFDITSSASVNINKGRAYVKETADKLYIFGFDYVLDSKTISIEFRIVENNEE